MSLLLQLLRHHAHCVTVPRALATRSTAVWRADEGTPGAEPPQPRGSPPPLGGVTSAELPSASPSAAFTSDQLEDFATVEADADSGARVAAEAARPAFTSGARRVSQLFSEGGAQMFKNGVVHVNNTFNNTQLSLTDVNGVVKASASCGTVGYKNAMKATPQATEKAAEDLARRALQLGYSSVVVRLKGMGKNKQYAVQALYKAGLRITQLQEVTPVPYNGCRLPRKRRT